MRDNDIGGNSKAKFWDNKQFTQYLYSNRPFPVMTKTQDVFRKLVEDTII